MYPTKPFFLAVTCCLTLLSACQQPQLPATTPPLSPGTSALIEETTLAPATSAPQVSQEIFSSAESSLPAESSAEPVATSSSHSESESDIPQTLPPSPATEPATTSAPPPATEPSTTSSSPSTAEPFPDTEPITTPESPSPSLSLDRRHGEEAFQLQNQLLNQHNVTPLQWSESLYQIAARRAEEISADYSHNGCPDWVAENILMGTNRPDLAVQIWYDSPGHQRNMLAGWTYCAIANYGYYWVAIYAMVETS